MSLFRPPKPKPEPAFDQGLYDDPFDRRSGADRRRGVEKSNGLSVLLAGCSKCDRIAPSPIEMHIEGWEMVWEGDRLVSITCPKHREPDNPDNPVEIPEYIVPPSGR
jgi:hypothetical protein